MCSDTGTEYCMGDRAWLLGLSDSSVHGVTTEVAGSSLTGMGVAKGAGMHCALDRSAVKDGNGYQHEDLHIKKLMRFWLEPWHVQVLHTLLYLVQCLPEIPAH